MLWKMETVNIHLQSFTAGWYGFYILISDMFLIEKLMWGFDPVSDLCLLTMKKF